MSKKAVSRVVPGLEHEVEIIVDRWGIPHIFARSTHDAFFAQGWNAARDRLWQIDLWRRRGLGELAEVFGPAYVEKDRAARLLLYRGDMDKERASYGGDARAVTTAFVAGINAYVLWLRDNTRHLPMEFKRLGHRPALWRPEDVVSIRSHGRVRNLEHEVLRTGVATRFGLEVDALRKGLEPEWKTKVPDGLELAEIPPGVMATYRLGTEPATFSADRLAASGGGDGDGSNNWALAPGHTTTGRPILASDPHRVHDMPSLRYISHLSAPGLDVIGAAEPAVPGVSLGHNGSIAFGLTIFPVDQEDLYVYELDPTDPLRYRYAEDWERFRVTTERLEVRGSRPVTVELLFSRHGPILHVDRARNRAYGLKSVWLEPGTAPYYASLDYIGARDWRRFEAAAARWGSPSVNLVYADVAGGIGWITAGFVPVRPNWDGLMPVPGDGRYEWRGFMPAQHHPREHNPKRGWVGSANQMNLPKSFDHAAHKPGFEWSDRSRFQRLSEGLESRRQHSIEAVKALQTDFTSMHGRRVTALLGGLASDDPKIRTALDLLLGWDHGLAASSAAAALFEVWFAKHLAPAVIKLAAPAGALEHFGVLDPSVVVKLLEHPGNRFDRSTRDRVLIESLASAIAELEKRLGRKPEQWQWGKLHHGFFEHPLSGHLGDPSLNVGPGPKGGNAYTVNNNGYRPEDFRVISGVSWRMVVDVGNWDNSWTINTPGQSGDPKSPHYRDLFEAWTREEYVPLLYTRPAIEKAAVLRINLSPG
ncbi:MAG: penicillin acylase family protein [Proteobacteria bacterium]|nr:penicillin acylase family protein [Pseudomonadota bacterium]MBI3499851.1 penicillin acylase family protein [Pseudomonadota bacterium]